MQVFKSSYATGYDALYREKNYIQECDLIERLFHDVSKGPVKNVLDIGCGTGGHAIELARRSYHVTGVDLSTHMLAIAKDKAAAMLPAESRPDFLLGDAKSFSIGEREFDAAAMMFAVVGYLTSNDDVIAALTNIGRHLKAGAPIVCDFWWGPAVLTQRPAERVRIVNTTSGRLLRATKTSLDTNACVADVHFNLFQISPNAPTVETYETHRMRYFFGPEIELLLRCAGFRLHRLGQFPNIDMALTDQDWNAVIFASKN